MTKHWKKTVEGNYTFYVDNYEAGAMEIFYATLERKAICRIESNEFVIKRTGFWKSTIEINNETEQAIARVYPEKWYASSWTLEYNDNLYRLIVRNNPLAEWAILDNSLEVAAYGLSTDNGKIRVRITTSDPTSDYLFDFLLWYLFVPIATENMGDSFAFFMLVNTP
jgi:hypothetical protein